MTTLIERTPATRLTYFKASLANLVPLIILGIIYAVIFFVAALPFGLGFLVALPMVWGSAYASFKDVFGG